MGVISVLYSSSRGTKLALLTFALGIGGAVKVAALYDTRGLWYLESGAGPAVLGWLIGAAAASSILAGALVSETHAGRRRLAISGALGLVACLAMATLRWFSPAPTVEGASRSLAAGHLELAEIELLAAEARGADPLESATVRARIRAQLHIEDQTQPQYQRSPERVSADDRRLSSLGEFSLHADVNTVLLQSWDDLDKQSEARRRVLERAQAQVDSAWSERDAFALRRIAEHSTGLDPEFTRICLLKGILAEVEPCLESGDLECVRAGRDLIEAQRVPAPGEPGEPGEPEGNPESSADSGGSGEAGSSAKSEFGADVDVEALLEKLESALAEDPSPGD